MRISMGSKNQFEPGSWLEAIQEVVVGTLTGGIRAIYVVSSWIYVNILRPLAKAVGIHLPEGKREKTPGGKLKVAAVGFGRTGTVRWLTKSSGFISWPRCGFPDVLLLSSLCNRVTLCKSVWCHINTGRTSVFDVSRFSHDHCVPNPSLLFTHCISTPLLLRWRS